MESFGTRLQALRKARGFTQDSIAEKLNVSAQAVSKWENDMTSPDMDTLVKLAEIFDVTLDELMGRAVKKTVYLAKPEETPAQPRALRVKIDSADGDKIWVNLPLELVKAFLPSNSMGGLIGGDMAKAMEGIDFAKIVELADRGVLGEIVRVDSADGDHIAVFVE